MFIDEKFSGNIYNGNLLGKNFQELKNVNLIKQYYLVE